MVYYYIVEVKVGVLLHCRHGVLLHCRSVGVLLHCRSEGWCIITL